MLDIQYRAFLIEGHRRFVETGNRMHIEDAIQLVKSVAPEHFYQGDNDKTLTKRVFYDEPYSAHWSGTYIRRYKSK
jgi:hypothetical protein